ncbi:hypothetical protein E4U57_007536 [Claviceps arundinis]|uniref:Glycoside hydrolase n=1 Tax=Claviceps arundinis TaxID=1623583 RepID=A0A9P7MMM3_9HYPO|nr:hypothetical protein E4U56_004684 [Claviceps arundinis]KAG5961498.1 hypothetical protein E4U57_007536 [Claviceps arundinis]
MLSKVALVTCLISSALAGPLAPPYVVQRNNPEHHISNIDAPITKPINDNRYPLSPHDTRTYPRLHTREVNQKVLNAALANHDMSETTFCNSSGVDTYQMYRGNGSPSEGWPEKALWVPFENMFRNYRGQMLQSCGNQNPPQPNNDEQEVKAIYDGILKASVASGVDRRFILAILMQESKGCVRAPTTNYGVRNPGLMQNHDGAGTCNEGGLVKKPCPVATIHQMISEGVSGTAAGDGLANCINVAGGADVSAFYKAARIYNSGSIAKTGQLQDGIATHCYASDVAK